MKEIIVEIIQQHRWPVFVVIYAIHSITVFVFITLGLQFYGVKARFAKLIPFLLMIPFYHIFGQAFLPRPLYSLIFLGIYIFVLAFIGKASIIKNFIAIIFILFLSSIGLIIANLLISYRHNLDFLYKTEPGLILGSISEIFFPTFMLVLFSAFNISLTSPKHKLTKLDKLSIIFFTLLFFAIYFLLISFIVIYSSLRNNLFIIMLSSELVLVIGAIVLFFIIHYISKIEQQKQLENQQIKLELEQSDRLLETFSSEQREYRNQLQVMKMLLEMGKNEELGRYIEQVASGISIGFTANIDNPIISSLLMSELILAREKSINVKIQCNTSLKNINPVKVGKILKLTLEMIINQQLTARVDQNQIFLDITENNHEYLFQFKNSELALQKFKSKAVIRPPLAQHANFMVIEALLNDLEGSYFWLDNGYTILLKIKFPKTTKGSP
jgi:hypothetical protein